MWSIDCEEQQDGCQIFLVYISFSAKILFVFFYYKHGRQKDIVFPVREWVVYISQTNFLHSVYKHLFRKHFILKCNFCSFFLVPEEMKT